MASIQQKGDAWYCQFMYAGKRLTYTIGEVSANEARQWKAKAEHLLMRLDQGMIEIPPGVAITDFIRHDGKPPITPAAKKARQTTLHELRESYVTTHAAGAIEKSTLDTVRVHLDRLEETYGKHFVLCGLTVSRLQDHINRRQKSVAPVTIKKELDTFRTVWNWGQRMGVLADPFPGKGAVYAKTAEKLPFMTWREIDRRVKAGGDPDLLWDCLYLDTNQIADFLAFAEDPDGWLYPMLASAAYTGARRSELVRARVEDVDLDNRVWTLREKKRAKGKTTTRRVPISNTLAGVLKTYVATRDGKDLLFGDGQTELTDSQTYGAFTRLVQDTKWKVIRGWHVLRHSFVSALASNAIDQRIIDEFSGHSTEEQRKRYRHIFPQVTSAAIAKVFG